MRRALLSLVLFAFAVLATWWALDEPPPPPVDPPTEPATGEADEAPERRRAQPAPTAEPEPEPEPIADPDTWVVRVLGPEDRPILGAIVVVGTGGAELDHRSPSGDMLVVGLTDASGSLTLPKPEDAGSYEAVTGNDPQVRAALEPETTLRLPRALPMTIRAVDAETGAVLDTDISISRTSFFGRMLESVRIPRTGPVSHVSPGPAQRGGELDLKLRPSAPEGYVVEFTQSEYDDLSALARELRVTVPVRREADLRLHVLDHLGQPVAGADVDEVQVSGTGRTHTAERTDAQGRTRIRGVAFIRRNRLRVRASRGMLDAWSEWVRPSDAAQPIELVVRLPEEFDLPFEGPGNRGTIGIGGAGGDADPEVPEEDLAAVTVRVVAADGSRPENIRVSLHRDGQWARLDARTDALGDAVFHGLPPGTYHAISSDPGMVPAAATVALELGKDAAVLLREPTGRPLTVRVVDPDGDPMPFAWVYVGVELHGRRVPLERVIDGVQEVPLLANADGVVTLPRVPVGTLVVNAGYGRLNEGTESDADEVEIVLGGD